MVDPFVIYDPLYSDLRECVSGAMYGKQLQQLTESTEVETASGLYSILVKGDILYSRKFS